MKLSMWILANLLGSFEPEIQIRENSPRVLRSARMAHATNCVYVQPDGSGCVCSWNNDRIRLPDISAIEGYELLQSLFDSMFDWYDKLSAAAEQRDYQTLVDLCHSVFRNPMVLCAANHKCLAMSSQYDAKDVDGEWEHLKTYGYPSMMSSKTLGDAEVTYPMCGEIVQFRFPQPSGFSNCLSSHLLCEGVPVGFLTVIEKGHPINDGDIQLLQVVSQILIPVLSEQEHTSDGQGILFQHLMDGKSIPANLVQQAYLQKNWHSDHTYRVILPDFGSGQSPAQLRERYYHFGALGSFLPEDIFGFYQDRLVILANETLYPHGQRLSRLDTLLKALPVRISFSLPCQGFSLIPELYKQAVFALDIYGSAHPDDKQLDFYECAIDYLIRSPYSPDTCLAACHPDALLLLRNDEILYRTLVVYLNQDRSVTKTIQCLYVHKNTLLHRLKKIEEILQYDLSDAYCREYLRLSFILLERHAGRSARPTV